MFQVSIVPVQSLVKKSGSVGLKQTAINATDNPAYQALGDDSFSKLKDENDKLISRLEELEKIMGTYFVTFLPIFIYVIASSPHSPVQSVPHKRQDSVTLQMNNDIIGNYSVDEVKKRCYLQCYIIIMSCIFVDIKSVGQDVIK